MNSPKFKKGDIVLFVKNKKQFIGKILEVGNIAPIVEQPVYRVGRLDRLDDFHHLFGENELTLAPLGGVLHD